jgi:predicted acylesterase/phospholipase RssA
MIDNTIENDDVETIIVSTGGGSRGWWAWQILMLLASRFKIAMICGTSAGALNAYGFGRGATAMVSGFYRRVFSGETNLITGPGLAELVNGKFTFNEENIIKYLLTGVDLGQVLEGVNLWDLPKIFSKKGKRKLVDEILTDNLRPIIKQILDNVLSAPTLLDNAPLYDRITEIQESHPTWVTPAFWNRVNMVTGELEEFGWDTDQSLIDEMKSVVSSSTIPLLWPMVDGKYGDGGLREGTPLDQIFRRLDPAKKYRIIMIECSSDEMSEKTTLNNPIHVASRILDVMMNESRRNDVKAIWDKNQEAREKGEALGRRYVPIYRIVCSATYDSLDFSPEAGRDFEAAVPRDWNKFLAFYSQDK